MTRYVIRRLGFFAVTIFFTSVLIFFLTRVLPGDVCSVKLGGQDATEATLAACEKELGLDRALPVQYVEWGADFIKGDWGESFIREEGPIAPQLRQRLANSGRLALVTLSIAVPLSLILGVIAGLNENSIIDSLISLLTLSFVSLPEFVTSIFLINFFALRWNLLPATAIDFDPSMSLWESMEFLILPALAATLVLLGYITRLTRAGVIEELKRDYVRTAELKGMPYWKVIIKHVLRNALLPTVTVIAISIGWLMSGLVVIEWIFRYQGVGDYLISGVDGRDLPRIQAIVMVTVGIFLIMNFLADLLYALLNPRIRLS